MADEEAADDSKYTDRLISLTCLYLGLQGQAERIFNDTKEKVTEYTDAAMEKVQGCKVS